MMSREHGRRVYEIMIAMSTTCNLHAKHAILIDLEFACIIRWRLQVSLHNSLGSLSAVTENNSEIPPRLRLHADPGNIANIEPGKWKILF